MLFPYIKEDLIDESLFRQMCNKKGYRVRKELLSYLDKQGLLSPLIKSKYSSKYSIHQFYIIQFIKEHRYNLEGFINTYHNYSKDKHDKLISFFDEHIIDFDNKFHTYNKKFIDFFEIYYRIMKYCIGCGDYIYKKIETITKDKQDLKNYITNITFVKDLQQQYGKEYNFKLSEEEKEAIKWFMTKILNKYKTQLEIYITTPGAKTKFKNIADFEIVRDFLTIFNTIEIYENISGEQLKEVRMNRVSRAGTYAQCIVCNRVYLKGRINQKTCSVICSKIQKNNHKKEMRKKNPEYGA